MKSFKAINQPKKIALTIVATLFAFASFAQQKDYEGDPKANERIIGTVTGTTSCDDNSHCWATAYIYLLEKAKKEYPNKVIDLRNLDVQGTIYAMSCSAKVVEFISPERQMNETLVKAVDKSLNNVRAGSRLAIDQISVSSINNATKETLNDQLIDILLDRGYKVVAKEYLEKLKEEQEQQTGGGFNEKTTAKTDNFSGAGYFLNVRANEKSIRIQVINVSTGEYEGNATVEF